MLGGETLKVFDLEFFLCPLAIVYHEARHRGEVYAKWSCLHIFGFRIARWGREL